MGERKVLNKYYPPDFDPAKIPRRKQPKNNAMNVRNMLPMSIQCNTCGNYIYKGTKFNSRKESTGETYLGIPIFRFYFKCPRCSAELAIKTDPKNSDYTVECGASRNFEPWRDKDEEVDREKRKRDAEEMGDAMKSLENRTLDSKREMDIISALDEMKSMKSRHAAVNFDEMLGVLQRTGDTEDLEKKLDEEDEALIKSIFLAPKEYVRRIDDDEWDDDEADEKSHNNDQPINGVKRPRVSEDVNKPTDILTKSSVFEDANNTEPSGPKPSVKSPAVSFVVKKKPVQKPVEKNLAEEAQKQEEQQNTVSNVGLQSLCQYDSDD